MTKPIADVLSEHADALMALPGVNGIAQGEKDGETCVLVLVVELTDEFGDDALQMALAGGEDYELLITAPFDVADRVLARMDRGVKHIGRIVEAPDAGPHVTVRDRQGNPVEVTGQSWDHLL